jgi:hypothetical protein
MRAWLLVLALAGVAGAADETTFQNVVVKRGDTLWSIANAYLKDPGKWDEILKYNKLPSADPTVALPGMTLRVPVRLIKEDLRAAHLIYKSNRVDFRRKETADWKGTGDGMELFKGDALRTLEDARAKVKFLNADLLSVDPNSLVIIKPPKQDFDVELKTGSIFTGRSRVITASARVTPKTRDTQFETRITSDFTTQVSVHRGLAAVEAQGRTVDVKAGMATQVKMGLAPEVPRKIPDLPEFQARAAEFNGESIHKTPELGNGVAAAGGAADEELARADDASNLKGEATSLRVGVPISRYRVQASLQREFSAVAFDKTFDAEDRLEMRYERINPGVYWFRIALIDLLGSQQRWSTPRLFAVGSFRKAPPPVDFKQAVKIARPSGETDTSDSAIYKLVGVTKNDRVTVTVDGKAVRQDESGNFSADVKLKDGANDIDIVVTDPDGNSTTISRRIFYKR